jgi:nitrate/nitrite transport system substrate-binding protein
MSATGVPDLDTAKGSSQALKQVIDRDRAANRPKLTFAVVYPESSHNYLLRYWLADAGIDPDEDLRLTVVPPPQVGHYLRAGLIAGYCVGEPWNTYAVSEGLGRTLITSFDIWSNHPEKVFAVTRSWAQANPGTHQAVVTALLEACTWLDDPENRPETCELLSQGRYVNAPVDILEKSLTGTLQFSSDEKPRAAPDYNIFHRYAANFPWRSHALWFLSQMLRWGQVDAAINPEAIAKAVYRPEVYRAAADALGLAYPQVDYKLEGLHAGGWALMGGNDAIQMGPDQFMDGRLFDASHWQDYLGGFSIRRWPPEPGSNDAEATVVAQARIETAI